MPEGKMLWEPSPEAVERARMTDYMRSLDRGFETYDDLWRWSVDDIEGFWESLWRYCDVEASKPYERVLGSREMPGAEWFPGAELNYAEHIFRMAAGDRPAIVHASELRELSEWSCTELREQTARIAAGLRRLGVERGDRVVAYMPNIPETVAALLACASIGAIWSSAAPEFGAPTVIDRFSQIEPKVLLAIDGYRYGGKDFDRRERVAELERSIPSLEHTVVLPYLGDQGNWDDVFPETDTELEFEQVPFDHPLWVLYSSGTTGLPKAIVQGHGGILLEQLKKSRLHLDLSPDDRLFWFTTTGWMMWNFLIGGLLAGSTIVLYDGQADPEKLWGFAADAGVTCFGTSAGFIAACMKAGVEPPELPALRSVGSTGSPLPVEGFEWVYEHVSPDVWLFSTSGGTDLCTAFVGGTPLLPVYAGELQARCLGAGVEAWDEEGHALEDEVGELVITKPMPSMPLFFWGDDDGERYRSSYFDMYPGIWRHGDWIKITPRGGAVIYGRSDSTINRQGIRMGTSEIYSAVEGVPEVLDSLVLDIQRADGGAWMPLFVVLAEGARLDDDLRSQIARRIREHCSPRHVPDELIQIEEVPRTLSGKKLEVPVKKILMGADPERAASRDSLANPASLDFFSELAGRLVSPTR
ncbi:MAG TPA: acetoacetate--CoA ligase [Thermoleophilaceae bacterium]|jgi:acetoacetyl-CoA synthetase